MSPKNPGKAIKSIRAKIAFPASIAVTTAAVCVSVRDDVPAASKFEKKPGVCQSKSYKEKLEDFIGQKIDRNLKIA